MAGSLSARKSNAARLKLTRPREASELLDARGDAMVDATYGDTLRKLMPRRLSALTRSRVRG
jgi:hypothetical protein